MTTFLRLLADKEKQSALVSAIRMGGDNVFEVDPVSFFQVPGAPFAYWVSDDLRNLFVTLPVFETEGRAARVGLQSSDDFRFLRANWEIAKGTGKWVGFAKGGMHSPYYADVFMSINWAEDGAEIKAWASALYGSWSRIIKNADLYFRPGLFQTLRAARLAPHATPSGCIFSDNGTQAFVDSENLLAILALLNSRAADALHKLLLGRSGYALYRNGTLARLPIPHFHPQHKKLSDLSRRAWSARRKLDTVTETSHAFLLPGLLQRHLSAYDSTAIEIDMANIQSEIDVLAFDLYGYTAVDRAAVQASNDSDAESEAETSGDSGADSIEEEPVSPIDDNMGLLSWAVGVAFGHFDWRLATGERQAPREPDPFDPLPAKSPGILPDGAEPFHAHAGILVDDQGHPHDIARLIEEVLARVSAPVPDDVRRWLQRDFFAFHLQSYSKSRRKAPIYWPLSTTSGSYTLWLYYPKLTSQTLYTAINDFFEPKLKQVGADVTTLRNKGSARSWDDEKQFDVLQSLELELIELRDTLLKLAPTYKPNHDDGVQIAAAPLWPLFRHKPWQKMLKDTWTKLEKGDYDWAHLAMNYWSERVREKSKTDKSLAIAHGLEDLYVEPEAKPKKARGKNKSGGDE
jgi:hypothetical protein